MLRSIFQKRGVASLANAAAAKHSLRQETDGDMVMSTPQFLANARHTEDDLSETMDKKDELSLTTDKNVPITSKDYAIQVFYEYLYITTFCCRFTSG